MELRGRESANIVDRRGEPIPRDIDLIEAFKNFIHDLQYGTSARFKRDPMQGPVQPNMGPIPDEVIERIIREGR